VTTSVQLIRRHKDEGYTKHEQWHCQLKPMPRHERAAWEEVAVLPASDSFRGQRVTYLNNLIEDMEPEVRLNYALHMPGL
jgi:hypothetical protein